MNFDEFNALVKPIFFTENTFSRKFGNIEVKAVFDEDYMVDMALIDGDHKYSYANHYNYSQTTLEDLVKKIEAVKNNQPYDPNVVMEFEIDDDLLAFAEQQAKEQNISLNDYLVNTLRRYIDSY